MIYSDINPRHSWKYSTFSCLYPGIVRFCQKFIDRSSISPFITSFNCNFVLKSGSDCKAWQFSISSSSRNQTETEKKGSYQQATISIMNTRILNCGFRQLRACSPKYWPSKSVCSFVPRSFSSLSSRLYASMTFAFMAQLFV